MHSNGQRITFAAPRRLWRWVIAALFIVCSILLAVLWATSPDPDSGLGLAMTVILLPLWPVSLFGGLLAWFSWFVQVRNGGSGTVAWMDSEGVHVRGGEAVSWPEVESIFTRRAPTGDLLLCIRPTDTAHFIARAASERQVGMRSNLNEYEAPLFINLSAFWQGSTDDLSAVITRFSSGRLTLLSNG